MHDHYSLSQDSYAAHLADFLIKLHIPLKELQILKWMKGKISEIYFP